MRARCKRCYSNSVTLALGAMLDYILQPVTPSSVLERLAPLHYRLLTPRSTMGAPGTPPYSRVESKNFNGRSVTSFHPNNCLPLSGKGDANLWSRCSYSLETHSQD